MIGMEFSPLITVLEGDFNMDNNASSTETDTLDDDTKLMSSKGKPPRHLSTTSSRLQVAVTAVILFTPYSFWILYFCNWDSNDVIGFLLCDQDLDVCKSPDERSDFLPVYRSGSCAEQGAKQFMEDEHICIDDLVDHLGASLDSSSLSAFYGVSV